MSTEPTSDSPELRERAFGLMKELVSITSEKWVGPLRFQALADQRGIQEASERVVFLTGVRELVRTLPPLVFEDLDIRQSILDAAQGALEAAIDQEED